MSKMSDLALDIEESLNAGCDISSISKGMQAVYGFSPAEALKLINDVAFMLTSDEDQEIMDL